MTHIQIFKMKVELEFNFYFCLFIFLDGWLVKTK